MCRAPLARLRVIWDDLKVVALGLFDACRIEIAENLLFGGRPRVGSSLAHVDDLRTREACQRLPDERIGRGIFPPRLGRGPSPLREGGRLPSSCDRATISDGRSRRSGRRRGRWRGSAGRPGRAASRSGPPRSGRGGPPAPGPTSGGCPGGHRPGHHILEADEARPGGGRGLSGRSRPREGRGRGGEDCGAGNEWRLGRGRSGRGPGLLGDGTGCRRDSPQFRCRGRKAAAAEVGAMPMDGAVAGEGTAPATSAPSSRRRRRASSGVGRSAA